jgi:DNA-binding CsgD family transcriptional regulator
MLQYLLYIIFLLSVAMAAGGIILASRLRTRFKPDLFSPLLYYEVFIYTFGFYGIWGQVLIRSFLSPLISSELLQRFTDITLLLGLPFLIFAWLMMIMFSSHLSARKRGRWFVSWFLLFNFSILVILGYFITRRSSFDPMTLMKYYFIIMNLTYSFIVSNMIHFPGKGHSLVTSFGRRIIAPVIFTIMLAQCVALFFYNSQVWLGTLFIFTFFIGNTVLPVMFTYGSFLMPLTVVDEKDLSFEEFCSKYEVSPRESEIIREICNGLSNKEISDKLFITLQTVKDHTHRIYIKTNVKNRVQLLNLVKNRRAGE